MRKLFYLCVVLCMAFVPCLGQERSSTKFTTIKDLVEENDDYYYFESRSFRVQGKFVETYNEEKLLFSIEDQEYIIPIKLAKKDLGAVNRFRSLGLQKGDSLIVEGVFNKIEIYGDYYKGLVEARIIKEEIPSVDVKPSFKGGDINKFSEWVNKQLRYPKIAKDYGVQGRVTLQFTVKSDGSVADIRVLRGVDESLDKEAMRVVSCSPKWEPGQSDGRPVDVTITFPVIFQLR